MDEFPWFHAGQAEVDKLAIKFKVADISRDDWSNYWRVLDSIELSIKFMERRVMQWASLMEGLTKRMDSFIEATEQSHRLMLSLMGWEPPPELAVLELPAHVSNVLFRRGFKTVEDVLAATPKQLLALRGFGMGALASLEAELESKGYSREAKP